MARMGQRTALSTSKAQPPANLRQLKHDLLARTKENGDLERTKSSLLVWGEGHGYDHATIGISVNDVEEL